MISYITNWMGPICIRFYIDNGLSPYYELKYSKVLDSWFRCDFISQYYSGGRIDISGVPNEPYGTEFSVPIMKGEDWNRLSDWLDDFFTEELITFEELITEFEKTNPAIQWWKD